jgi:hypothetical protein
MRLTLRNKGVNMKAILVAIVAVGACILLAPAARCQTNSGSTKKITIKIGGYFPQNSTAKGLGNSWTAAGLEYSPSKAVESAAPASEIIYADYTSKTKNNMEDHILGIGVGTRTYTQGNGGSSRPFAVAGIGAYFQTANVTGQAQHNTSFGGKVGIGEEFGGSLFIEGDYNYITSSVSGINLGGFTVSGGLRF